MIEKVKDLSKSILNNDDVLLKVTATKRSSILILDGLSESDKSKYQESIIEVIAVGANVKPFEVGDIVVDMKGRDTRWDTHQIDINDELSPRVFVTHMNNIEFAVKPENYVGK